MTGDVALEALFEFATEGILVSDGGGVIIKINPAAEKLFGYDPGELLGKKVELLIPDRFSSQHTNHRDKFNRKPHARSMGVGTDLYARRKDDSEFPVEISLSPYQHDGENFVIAFIIDITERKAAREKLESYSEELEKEVEQRTLILKEAIWELEKTKEELNESLTRQKELNELKSRFVSMVSHEFRTPLATMLSSLSLVARYTELQDTEKQQKHIDRIKTSVNNLTDILNDVLSLSKLEEGKVSVTKEYIPLQETVSEIITEIQPLAKEGQNISYQHHGEETTAFIDTKILRHIMMNLLSNAIKFSHAGSAIDVSTAINSQQIELMVKDNGIGISEEDQKHLFESFYRAQNAVNIQGTGLGLNIVLRYVDLCGGSIKMNSILDQGTTFTITLPINHLYEKENPAD